MLEQEIENKLWDEACDFPIGRFTKSNGTVNYRKITQLLPDFRQDALNLIFVRKAVEIHGRFFGYREVEYKTSKQFVRIYCPDHEGFFIQVAAHHLAGYGCPLCKGKVIARTTEVGNFTVPCSFHKYSLAENHIIWYNKFNKLKLEIKNDK